jgi:hypothetical protein
MTEDMYRLILTGYVDGTGEYYIEENLAKLFKITREKSRELLSGGSVTIKENLAADQAARYKAAINKAGAKCEIENMQFNIGGLSLE